MVYNPTFVRVPYRGLLHVEKIKTRTSHSAARSVYNAYVTSPLDRVPTMASNQQDTRSGSERSQPSKTQERQAQPKPKPGQSQSRPTHFIMLPLTTPESMPQLVESLAHFRAVSTAPEPSRRARQNSRPQANPTKIEDATPDIKDGFIQISDEPKGDTQDMKQDNAKGHERHMYTLKQEHCQVQPEIRNSEPISIIPAKAHRPPGTFHLTLGVMDLKEPEKLKLALELLRSLDLAAILRKVDRSLRKASTAPLQDIAARASEGVSNTLSSLKRSVSPPRTKEDIKDIPSLELSLQGLGVFPSPRSARVFWARPVDPTNRLEGLALEIHNMFKEAGLVKAEDDLTLHATVANMSYVTRSKGNKSRRGKIDATELVSLFDRKDGRLEHTSTESDRPFVWANCIMVDKVRLCKMGAVKSEDENLGMEYPAIEEKGYR